MTACAAAAAASNSLTLTDLPPLTDPNGQSSASTTIEGVGFAINATGQVAGYAGISTGGIGPYTNRAFFYDGSAMTDLNLGGLDGNASPDGQAFGLNASGTVVGHSTNTSLNSYRAFVTSGGMMTDLDAYDLTISQSIAYGVTSGGTTIAGIANYSSTGPWHPLVYTYSGTYSPATGVYSGGTWSYLDINGILGTTGGRGMAQAVNDAGTVTGYATYAISGYYTYVHAFARSSSGGVTDLGSLPGMDSSIGNAINASGDVAGMAFLSDFGGSVSVIGDPGVGDQAFLAVNGPGGYTMTDLGAPAGDNASEAYGVNKYDMVVGDASDNFSGQHAFLWTTGVVPFYGLSLGPNDLNTLATNAGVLPSGWVITNARGINDSGQITGSATDSNSVSHAFVLSLPQALPGDANLDGTVDINDLTIVLAHYGQTGTTWAQGEFTGDGTVDINDLTIVLAHYGQSVGASAARISAVPEPSVLALLAAGLAGLLAYAWRRRR